MLPIALFALTHPQPRVTCMRELLGASLLVKSTFEVDLKWLVMRPTAPENFDGDATTDRLDPTGKAQVDSSRLNRPDSQVYYNAEKCTEYTGKTWCKNIMALHRYGDFRVEVFYFDSPCRFWCIPRMKNTFDGKFYRPTGFLMQRSHLSLLIFKLQQTSSQRSDIILSQSFANWNQISNADVMRHTGTLIFKTHVLGEGLRIFKATINCWMLICMPACLFM